MKAFVTDPVKQCFESHRPKKDQDYLYSTREAAPSSVSISIWDPSA
jgi:hypothetical protein